MKLLPLLLLALLVPLAVPAKALGGEVPSLEWTTTITRAQFDQDYCCEAAGNPWDTADISQNLPVNDLGVDANGDLWLAVAPSVAAEGSQTALLRLTREVGLVIEEVFITCLSPTGGATPDCSSANPESFGFDGAGRPMICVSFSASPEPAAQLFQFNLDGSSAYDGQNMSAVAAWSACPNARAMAGKPITASTQEYVVAQSSDKRYAKLNNTAKFDGGFNVATTPNFETLTVDLEQDLFFLVDGTSSGGSCNKVGFANGTIFGATRACATQFGTTNQRLMVSQNNTDRLFIVNTLGSVNSGTLGYSRMNKAAWTEAVSDQAFTPSQIQTSGTNRDTEYEDSDLDAVDNILGCGKLSVVAGATLGSWVASLQTGNNTQHWNITSTAAGANSGSFGCRFDFNGGFYWVFRGLDSGSCCSIVVRRYDYSTTNSGFTNPIPPDWGNPDLFFGSPAGPPTTPDLVSESGDVASAFQTFATGIGFETPASQWFFGLILLSIIACTLAAIGYVITKSGDVSAIFASVGVIGGDILNVYFDFWELVWAIVLIVLVGLVGAYLIRKQFIGTNSGG